ncbi:MAG: lysophospholipid acyltransferase family protein [Acidobacteria bacterium]|nr:lysophospholipid acyltransferase family protein [Acidobacteriota bacterium]
MIPKNNKAFTPADLSKYSFKDRAAIRAADIAFYLLIRTIGRTIRYEVEGWENFDAIEAAGKLPIYAFWHNRIFASTYFFRNRGIAVITSQSKDGEYIARFIQRLGYGAIRGSSTRGGVGALVEMIKAMRNGTPTAFTLDGPKGPRYVVKPGALMLAKKTGNPVIPFLVECRSFWTINSWDRLQIPKPFTKAKLIIGKPLYCSENADEHELDKARMNLQSTLDELAVLGKEWSQTHHL